MASKANIVIDQGSTFLLVFELTDEDKIPINLIGVTANGAMRKYYTTSNLVNFSTTTNGEYGSVSLTLTANQTNSLVPGRYVYDVELNNSGVISRVVEGYATVTPRVLR